MLEVCLGLDDVGVGGFLGGDEGVDVGFGGGDGGLLGRDGGLWLDAFHGGEDSTFFDLIAFLDVEVGDASEGGGAYVDVGLRLDLPGTVDDGGEVLTDDFAGRDFGDVGLAMNDAACDDTGKNQYCNYNNDDLLRAHPDAPFFHVRWGAERYFFAA